MRDGRKDGARRARSEEKYFVGFHTIEPGCSGTSRAASLVITHGKSTGNTATYSSAGAVCNSLMIDSLAGKLELEKKEEGAKDKKRTMHDAFKEAEGLDKKDVFIDLRKQKQAEEEADIRDETMRDHNVEIQKSSLATSGNETFAKRRVGGAAAGRRRKRDSDSD